MKKPSHTFGLAAVLALITALGWTWLAIGRGQPDIKQAPALAQIRLAGSLPKIDLLPAFYKPELYRQALAFADKIPPKKNIGAIIIPHDLTASRYAAALIKQAGGRDVNTVVIIGPNHDNIGVEPIATALAGWQTPDGYLKVNETLVEKFLDDFNLYSDPEVFEKEHAIGALAPFISHYLPNAGLVPVVFSSYADYGDVVRVAEWLGKNLPDDSLVVFSIDFSHYLAKQEADIKDEMTRALILDHETAKIMALNNDNVDSPATLATALQLAMIRQYDLDIIYHSNSFDLAAAGSAETTSHFGIVFFKK